MRMGLNRLNAHRRNTILYKMEHAHIVISIKKIYCTFVKMSSLCSSKAGNAGFPGNEDPRLSTCLYEWYGKTKFQKQLANIMKKRDRKC